MFDTRDYAVTGREVPREDSADTDAGLCRGSGSAPFDVRVMT